MENQSKTNSIDPGSISTLMVYPHTRFRHPLHGNKSFLPFLVFPKFQTTQYHITCQILKEPNDPRLSLYNSSNSYNSYISYTSYIHGFHGWIRRTRQSHLFSKINLSSMLDLTRARKRRTKMCILPSCLPIGNIDVMNRTTL